MLLSQATGYISSGNLSAFDVIASKACKTTASNYSRKIACGNSVILSPKLCLQNADNCSMVYRYSFSEFLYRVIFVFGMQRHSSP